MPRPIILIIADGLGINPDKKGNAVAAAKTPVLEGLLREYPSTQLDASGHAVGLPEGQMGNSEVGHLNIGAGRIVYQDLTRINEAIKSGDFFKNEVLLETFEKVNDLGTSIHMMGLLSDGGVHSHIDHLSALIELARKERMENLFIHAFMDGRDTPPRSGRGYIEALEDRLREAGVGKISTVMGRFFAMDRDNRWERIKEACLCMMEGGSRQASSALEAMDMAYNEDKGDEFVPPTTILNGRDEPPKIQDGDAVIFFNFRADRAREITRAFTEKDFSGFSGITRPDISAFVCMTEYDATFGLPIAFPPVAMKELLGEIISEKGMKQLRIAETEKYAHVTFFFNGGEENTLPGEDRVLIPSPKDVRTYDEKPEMSANEVTGEVIRRMDECKYHLIVLNFANCDMVGHTGVMEAAVKALETVDDCLGRIMNAADRNDYEVIITSDHGNVEQMIDGKTGQPHTAHTANPVYFILAGNNMKGKKLRRGGLADIAPTILELFGIEKPENMNGKSLIEPV